MMMEGAVALILVVVAIGGLGGGVLEEPPPALVQEFVSAVIFALVQVRRYPKG